MADEQSSVTAKGLDYESFVAGGGERVRRALVGYYGVDIGTEAAAEALAVAWERWSEIALMDNPTGYVFRVGQSKARPGTRWHRRRVALPTARELASANAPDLDALVDVFAALRRLRPDERAAVLLTKSYGYSYREVAELLGVTEATVNNLVHRGITKLRNSLRGTT